MSTGVFAENIQAKPSKCCMVSSIELYLHILVLVTWASCQGCVGVGKVTVKEASYLSSDVSLVNVT